ncbi:MAG: transcriptional regulator with PAS, ATPase and Fis domain [Halioglobus sp.]
MQEKLLRVLETSKFRRVGGETNLTMSVRIVATTNRDPEKVIRDGLSREDLYFRIADFSLKIPALRDRGGEILGLTQLFLNEFNQ